MSEGSDFTAWLGNGHLHYVTKPKGMYQGMKVITFMKGIQERNLISDHPAEVSLELRHYSFWISAPEWASIEL